EDGGGNVDQRGAVDAGSGAHVAAVEVEDAVDPVEALAHPAEVTCRARIVRQLAGREARMGTDVNAGQVVYGREVLPPHAGGVAIHRLDRAAELRLLRRQLAREALRTVEMAEEMRRRV